MESKLEHGLPGQVGGRGGGGWGVVPVRLLMYKMGGRMIVLQALKKSPFSLIFTKEKNNSFLKIKLKRLMRAPENKPFSSENASKETLFFPFFFFTKPLTGPFFPISRTYKKHKKDPFSVFCRT